MKFSNFDFNKLETYYKLMYEGPELNVWIESGFETERDDTFQITYYFNFLPNDAFLKFDDKLIDMVIGRIINPSKDIRSHIDSIGDDLSFGIEIKEGEEPIVKDHDDRIVPFKSLVNVESFGRCKISIEGLSVFDDHVKPIIKLEEF